MRLPAAKEKMLSQVPPPTGERSSEHSSLRPLLVTNDFPPAIGGIQRFAYELASRLGDTAVLAGAHPDARAHDRGLGFPVMRSLEPFMLPTPRSAARIREAVAAHHANVVLFCSPLPLGLLGPSVGAPWAVVAHGAELNIPARAPGIAALTRRRLRDADMLFAVSVYTAQRLRAFVGADGPPIKLLRNGVPLEAAPGQDPGCAVRRRLGLGDAPVITCVGRMVPRKGQDRLLAALPSIRREVTGTRLLLVGDGRLRPRLERDAARLAPGSVVFAGSVPEDELPGYFAAGDVFAHPNRSRWLGLEQEGFGIIFLEAQARGRPVVAGRSGGAPEALREGETGILVDGASVEEIAHAVAGLLADRPHAARMGAAGRAFVREHFSWERIIPRLQADLGAIASQGRTGPRHSCGHRSPISRREAPAGWLDHSR